MEAIGLTSTVDMFVSHRECNKESVKRRVEWLHQPFRGWRVFGQQSGAETMLRKYHHVVDLTSTDIAMSTSRMAVYVRMCVCGYR